MPQAAVDAIHADMSRYKDHRFDALLAEMNIVLKEYIVLPAQRKSRSDNEGDASGNTPAADNR